MPGQKISQRVVYLIENFMSLHNAGHSISEIADQCKVVESTVYHNLQKIADLNGVSRESLLEVVHKPHKVTKISPKMTKPKSDVKSPTPEFILETCNKLLEDIEELQSQVKNFYQSTRKDD